MSTDLGDVYRVAEEDRRQGSTVRLGTVSAVDAASARVRVRMGIDQAVTDWLPWVAVRAGRVRVWSAPSVGEQALILAPSGELTQAVVLPGIYRDMYPPPSEDTRVDIISWDDGSEIRHVPGDEGRGMFLIKGDIGLTGNLNVTGDISATGKILDTEGNTNHHPGH